MPIRVVGSARSLMLDQSARISDLAIISSPVMLSNVSIKQQVLTAINRLPDDIDFNDIAEEIAFLAALEEAEDDIRSGKLIAHDQIRARVDSWLKR